MADFYTAVAITMDDAHEGGFQKDPKDSGNWTGKAVGVGVLKGTKWGISAAQFPDLDIENLSTAQAEMIYKGHYWNSQYDGIKEQSVANKLFDMGVLFGEGTAIEEMQKALQGSWPVVVDGKFGPITLNQINNSEPVSLLGAFKTILVTRAIGIGAADPNKRGDVADWVRRINS